MPPIRISSPARNARPAGSRRPGLLAMLAALTAAGGLLMAAGPAAPAGAAVRQPGAVSRAGAAGGGATGRSGTTRHGAGPAYANWPTFHGNPADTGLSNDPAISAVNAGQLGVKWMTHTFGPVLSSPVTEYSPTLNKTLAYVVNESGDLEAFNVADGSLVWSDSFGVPMHATPVVFRGHVWIGTAVSGRMIKVNAVNGTVQCQVSLGTGVDFASPVIGTAGGVPTLFVGVQDHGPDPGPMLAINDSTCKVEWRSIPYPVFSGSWSPDSYGVNKNGTPLVILGSGDPDCSVYALNANTGKKLWRVQSLTGGLADFGAGVAISPPGNNGFADGMAYASGKDRYLYGIDLTSGKVIWTLNIGAITGANYSGGRSAPALAGNTIVVGTPVGVAAVNATTGAPIWLSENTGPPDTEVLSSPLITGPPGQQVVVYGDLNGYVEVLSLVTGTVLYKFKTSGYVISSAADSAGNILIGSSDGFLYDLAIDGSNGTAPTAAITSPADGTVIPNPGANPLTATGSATPGSASISAVDVAVQLDGPAGQWWNAAKSAWQPGPAYNKAKLTTSGGTTNWSFGAPAPPQGGVLSFTARAVGSDQLVSSKLVSTTVTVKPVASGPRITVSVGRAAPNSTLAVSGKGFGAGEKVALSLPGVRLSVVTAGTKGGFARKSVQVPSTFDFGPTEVTAKGLRSGRIAAAPVYITGAWAQFGHDAQRTSNEPFDVVLAEEETPGKQYRMMPNWVYSAPGAIDSSPAVIDGKVFFGDQSGVLSAVNLGTGALAWSATAGGAIASSPAVDGSARLVIAGSADGNVYAWSEYSGKLAWQVSTGGSVTSSPVIAGGTVYVGSASHKLFAINESTGAVRWTAGVAGAITAAPALDPGASTIVVADSKGLVTAYRAGTGAATRRWQASAGAAVTASPVLEGGRVLVGAQNGTVSAYSESTGKLAWSTSVGTTAITGSMAYQLSHLYVGNAGGKLTVLHTSDGSVIWSEALAGPITGVSTTDRMLFAESSNGTVSGLRIGGEVVWLAKTGAGLAGTPVIVNNTVFVGAQDDGLYAFTPYGEPPV